MSKWFKRTKKNQKKKQENQENQENLENLETPENGATYIFDVDLSLSHSWYRIAKVRQKFNLPNDCHRMDLESSILLCYFYLELVDQLDREVLTRAR